MASVCSFFRLVRTPIAPISVDRASPKMSRSSGAVRKKSGLLEKWKSQVDAKCQVSLGSRLHVVTYYPFFRGHEQVPFFTTPFFVVTCYPFLSTFFENHFPIFAFVCSFVCSFIRLFASVRVCLFVHSPVRPFEKPIGLVLVAFAH